MLIQGLVAAYRGDTVVVRRCIMRCGGYALLMCLAVAAASSVAYHNSICPAPLPCHCIKDDSVFCSGMRLQKLPYMEFTRTWDALDLSENFLTRLLPRAFDGVTVQLLNLSRNTLSAIDRNAFGASSQLHQLDLSHNSLRTLSGFLHALPELSALLLRYNQLSTFKHDTFSASLQLKELDLTGNDLRVLPTAALQLMPALQHLILRHNRLARIDAYAFQGLPLELLDLGDNKSPLSVHSEAFCGLQPTVLHRSALVTDWVGLHSLLLDHNGLTSLTPCLTKLIWTLHTVDISGNPLHCDCHILNLRFFGTSVLFPGAQCATPDLYAGNFLSNINRTSCSSSLTAHNCKMLCQSPPPAAYRGTATRHHRPLLVLLVLLLAAAAL